MPLQSQDTSADKLKQSGPDVFDFKEKRKDKDKNTDLVPGEDVDANIAGEPNQTNYGFGQRANFNSRGEETEQQEYLADGLSRTNKYSVDDAGMKTKEQEGHRGRSGRDC